MKGLTVLTSKARAQVVENLRKALDALVRLTDERARSGKDPVRRDERVALRIRQAIEVLEGTGSGGFRRVRPKQVG